MCDPVSATIAVISAYSAYRQSAAAEDQARYNAVVADNNAKMAEYQAEDALARGEQEAMNVRRKAAAIKGDQRATMAARGLDLGEGSALSLLDQTDYFGALDVATTKGNAGKEAYALKAQANNFATQAVASRAAADAQSPLLSAAVAGAQGYAAGSSISKGFSSLGSGTGVADKWSLFSSGNGGASAGGGLGLKANPSSIAW